MSKEIDSRDQIADKPAPTREGTQVAASARLAEEAGKELATKVIVSGLGAVTIDRDGVEFGTAKQFRDLFKSNFDKMDANQDGMVDRAELNKRANSHDLTAKEAQMVQAALDNFDQLKDLSNESGSGKDRGISKADANAFEARRAGVDIFKREAVDAMKFIERNFGRIDAGSKDQGNDVVDRRELEEYYKTLKDPAQKMHIQFALDHFDSITKAYQDIARMRGEVLRPGAIPLSPAGFGAEVGERVGKLIDGQKYRTGMSRGDVREYGPQQQGRIDPVINGVEGSMNESMQRIARSQEIIHASKKPRK